MMKTSSCASPAEVKTSDFSSGETSGLEYRLEPWVIWVGWPTTLPETGSKATAQVFSRRFISTYTRLCPSAEKLRCWLLAEGSVAG